MNDFPAPAPIVVKSPLRGKWIAPNTLGNSTAPHLHFHLMDNEDARIANRLPCCFREYAVLRADQWQVVHNGICFCHLTLMPPAERRKPAPSEPDAMTRASVVGCSCRFVRATTRDNGDNAGHTTDRLHFWLIFSTCSATKVDELTSAEIIEPGKIPPVIDRTYPLERTAEALGYAGTGHARGKVVVAVE